MYGPLADGDGHVCYVGPAPHVKLDLSAHAVAGEKIEQVFR